MSWILSRLCCCQRAGELDLQCHVHPVDKKGPSARLHLDDVAGAAEQAEGSEMETPKEHRRSCKLMKKRLAETVHKDTPEMEPEVLQDNLNIRSLEKAKSLHGHQCPGMNEVLEMIRNGVSLRPVIKVCEDRFQLDEEEPQTSDQAGPELQRILKKRKECSERCVSDSSVKKSPVDTAVQGQESPWDHPGLRRSPRQSALGGLCQVNECEGDKGIERASCNGDGSSTLNTLPLSAPLDKGQEDWTVQCPESSRPVRSVDIPSVDDLSSPCSESPQEELSAWPRVNCTNTWGEGSEYDGNPDPRASNDNGFFGSPSQSLLQEHLDWEKRRTLGLKMTVPSESIGADNDHFVHFVEENLSHEEESSSLVTSDAPQS